ncbi:MAG: Excinuclease ABC C subunit domain protein [Candidatus Moranbacteria bacterium GW2011_GWE2_36_40]|nr:MAG: Excinuclease ABC C subunit domain protein [Candidatus Moranbacteria bacterium GW2011_GWE2_36_40]
MHYLYILKSLKDHKLYIGYTVSIVARLKKHNEGKVLSTKCRRPLVVVYCEVYRTETEARDREKKLKQFGKVYAQLIRRIKRSIDSAV